MSLTGTDIQENSNLENDNPGHVTCMFQDKKWRATNFGQQQLLHSSFLFESHNAICFSSALYTHESLATFTDTHST